MSQLPLHHHRILEALYRFHYLTAEQVRRLFYGEKSITTAQTRVKELTELRYILRIGFPKPPGGGSLPYFYALNRRGYDYLRFLGYDVPRRFRPKEIEGLSPVNTLHTRDVNDVLIAADLLHGAYGITVEGFVHERTLRRSPTYVTMNGRRRPVIPDGWVQFLVNRIEYPVVFEVDRGTMRSPDVMREKFGALARWTDGAYQERFGTDAVTFAITCPTEARRDVLMGLCRAELADMGREDLLEFFHFTADDPTKTEPHLFFLANRWRVPGHETGLPLIPIE